MDKAVLVGYFDSDFAGDEIDEHSTTGLLFKLAGGVVSCKLNKQSIIALSTV